MCHRVYSWTKRDLELLQIGEISKQIWKYLDKTHRRQFILQKEMKEIQLEKVDLNYSSGVT